MGNDWGGEDREVLRKDGWSILLLERVSLPPEKHSFQRVHFRTFFLANLSQPLRALLPLSPISKNCNAWLFFA